MVGYGAIVKKTGAHAEAFTAEADPLPAHTPGRGTH